MKCLFVIPARGGSKGIPDKNIQEIGGRSLITYAIDFARAFVPDEDICLTTDSPKIVEVAKKSNLEVPFMRPESLSSDTAGTYEVLLHAVDHYSRSGKKYEVLVLLQPTSPFRLKKNLQEALSGFRDDLEMVVSVQRTKTNPYLNLFKENDSGYLEKVIPQSFERRQDAPLTYEYNGAIYVIRIEDLKTKKLSEFTKVRKIEMDEINSVDIDTPADLQWARYLLANNLIHLDY